jgi:ketosteroid isomerase-like protein
MISTSSTKNEELVRAGYAAFRQGDMAAFNTLFVPDIIWHVPGRNPLSGDKHGIADTLSYFGQLMALTDGSFRIDLRDVLANESIATGIHHESATRTRPRARYRHRDRVPARWRPGR